MTMTTAEVKTEIFNILKETFSDIPYFNEYVAAKLQQAITESDNIELSFANVKNFARRFYETGRYETEEEKKKWKEIQWIFATCCVLIVSYQERATARFWYSIDELIAAYPMFTKLADVDELKLLLKFRNMLVAATLVLNPRLNKELIIYVAGRLEGTQRRYITGKGQRDAVTMRVRIYEKEGDITPEARPYRSHPEKLLFNEKRALLNAAEAGVKPKKKRTECQKGLLSTGTYMGAIKPLQGPMKICPSDNVAPNLSALHRNNSQLYLLANNAEAGYYRMEELFGSFRSEGAQLSDLTTGSFLSYQQSAMDVKTKGLVGRNFEELSKIMLASAHQAENNILDGDLFTLGSSNVPFPSLSGLMSLPSLSTLPPLPSLPASFTRADDPFRPAFPPDERLICETDVLLNAQVHAMPSYSEEWLKYLPKGGMVGSGDEASDPAHPSQTATSVRSTSSSDEARTTGGESTASGSSGFLELLTLVATAAGALNDHATTDVLHSTQTRR